MPATQQSPLAAGTQLPGSGLGQFMQLRGRRVVEACGVLWHSVEHGMYMSLPHQLRFDPDRAELERFLWRSNITGVKYPSVTSLGLASGLYLCTDKQYSIASPHKSFRQKIRRAMDRCEVHAVEESQLLAEGLQLNLDTMGRQGRTDPEFAGEESWKRFVLAIKHCPAIRAVGSFVQGRLAAYAITCREDGWFHILHRMSRLADLQYHPNHLLDFTLAQEIAKDPALQAVSMGYSSLVSTDGLHEYKRQLGYTFSPHNSVMVLHPLARPILTSWPVQRALAAARKFRPQDQHLERISAVIRGAELASGKLASNGSEPHAA